MCQSTVAEIRRSCSKMQAGLTIGDTLADSCSRTKPDHSVGSLRLRANCLSSIATIAFPPLGAQYGLGSAFDVRSPHAGSSGDRA